MNLKQLNYFYQLAKHKHFAKAAKACHITQPTLSASISALERELNTDLVIRNSQFLALTDEGKILLSHAEKILFEQQALTQALSVKSGELSGKLKLGVVPQSDKDIISIVKRFSCKYPNITLILRVMSNEQIYQELDSHALDIGLGFVPPNEASFSAYQFIATCQNRLAYITNQKSITADLGTCSLSQLDGQKVCLLSENMKFRQLIDTALETNQIELKLVLETDCMLSLATAVKQGLGGAIISLSSAKAIAEAFQLTYLEIVGGELSKTAFITRKTSMTPATKAFLSLLDQYQQS